MNIKRKEKFNLEVVEQLYKLNHNISDIAKIMQVSERWVASSVNKLIKKERFSHFHPLPQEEYNILKDEYENGKTLTEIGEKLNKCYVTISKYVSYYKLKRKKSNITNRKWTPEEMQKIKKLKNEGNSYQTISEIMDLPINCIKNQIYLLNRVDKIEKNWENIKEKFSELYNLNISYKKIAKKLNLEPLALGIVAERHGFYNKNNLRRRENEMLKKDNKRKCSGCKKIKNFSEFYSPQNNRCIECQKQTGATRNKINRTVESLENILNIRLKTALNRSVNNDFSFELDLDFLSELYKKQDGKCYYSNNKLSLKTGDDFSLSLDRIDSSKGYTKNNVVFCCKRINYMKSDMETKEFICLIKKIWEHCSNLV